MDQQASDVNKVIDLQIELLKVIDSQLNRLHKTLSNGDGDDDTTQEQITQLQEELCRLSEAISDSIIYICNSTVN